MYNCVCGLKPVLSRRRLLLHVVDHVHLLLVGGEHLEARPVAAQVIHSAAKTTSLLYLVHYDAVEHSDSVTGTVLTIRPRAHQCRPTSHILRTPEVEVKKKNS